MSRKLAAVMCLTVLSRLAPGLAWSQGMVRVYVARGDASGFTSGAGAEDSALDLIKSLRNRKTLVVVHSESEADVVVRLGSRHKTSSVGSFTTIHSKNKDDQKSVSTTYANQKTERLLPVTLEVDDFKLDLEGKSITGRGAADQVASQVEKWSKENYARLMDRQSKKSKDHPNARETSQETESATVQPGMNPDEVRTALGEPAKKITFEPKTQWTYGDGVQVIFQENKVTDVRF
jgi:hypothetical protein